MERSRRGHSEAVENAASRPRDPAPPTSDGTFAEVYARHHDAVWRTLAALGVPDASLDDGVQEVFVVVYRRLGDPQRYGSVRAWIYAIARRVAWRHHRGRERSKRRDEQSRLHPSPAPDPEDDLARREAAAFLQRFLARLDEPQRVVFVLAELEGLSAPEIASIVEAKVPTVYSRLRLARTRFQRAVARLQARQRRQT